MKISTTAGLVGFLLALFGTSVPKAEATAHNPNVDSTQLTIDSRLGQISKAIRQQENQAQNSTQGETDSFFLASGFLNNSSSFRNHTGGWVNNVKGWPNGGGSGFLNNSSSFRNHTGGWVNKVKGWPNSGGGNFANKAGPGGFVNKPGAGGFANNRY